MVPLLFFSLDQGWLRWHIVRTSPGHLRAHSNGQSSVPYSVGLDKSMTTYIHNVAPSTSTAHENFCTLYIPLCKLLTTTDLFIVFIASSRMSVLESHQMWPFQIVFIHLVISVDTPSMTWQCITFWCWTTTYWSGGTTVYLSIHLREGIFIASKFWQLWI